jgi:hypothetical protein
VQFYWLALTILSVWRVTHMLQAEDGPGDIFVRLRRRAGNGFWGKLLDCFYCLSVWVALPCAWLVGSDGKERFFLWLAGSAGAILVEAASSHTVSPPPATYVEDQGEEYVMLRQRERGTAGDESSSPNGTP